MPFSQLSKIAPDALRATIYQRAIDDAYVDFTTLAQSKLLSPRFKTALLDQGLLTTLAALLDEYVLCGVAADLGRCRSILYEARPVPVPPATAINIDLYINTTLPIAEPSKIDAARQRQDTVDAYKCYFEWFIAPAIVLQGGLPMSGIAAFQARNPMTNHAIDQISTHFRTNIRQACTRVLGDWNRITTIFFPTNPPKELVKITSTGSDFHKGGKQVLILTFKMNDNSLRKLVYKPSDIEADYRLVGMTAPIIADSVLGGLLGNQNSLTEELNTYLNDAYKLPTYRILPRNPGTTLGPIVGGVLPIDASYGYIEFLTHEPGATQNGLPLPQKSKQASDWVTSNENDIVRFYRQMGRLSALAYMFSVSDLHVDNLIVHALQPHMIDAEVSFTGPMASLSGTIILNNPIGALIAWDTPSARRTRQNDHTANLLVSDALSGVTHSPSYNRIYFAQVGKETVLAHPKNYAVHIVTGFLEMLTTMQNHNAQLLTWFNNTPIPNLVTRFTPEATAFFQKQLRILYSPHYCSDPVPVAPTDYNRPPYTDWLQEAQNKWSQPDAPKAWPSPRPNYVLASQVNNFADYLNCDIPAYYHRVGSTDLLNSRGQVVPVQPPLPATNYFPQNTLSIVQQQINNLLIPTQRKKLVDASLNDLLKALGY